MEISGNVFAVVLAEKQKNQTELCHANYNKMEDTSMS